MNWEGSSAERVHCHNCSRLYEQLATMVRTAVDCIVDLARNVLTSCSTSLENCSYMKENFDSECPLFFTWPELTAHGVFISRRPTAEQSVYTEYRPLIIILVTSGAWSLCCSWN